MFHIRFSEALERRTVNYENCLANAVKALKTRVFLERPQWNPSKEFARVMRKAAFRLGAQMAPELTDAQLEECLDKFPPRKREMYRQGLEVPIDYKKHMKVTMFVKNENVPYKAEEKPRPIQFRDPVGLAHQLPFIKPIEHAFYHGRYLFNEHQKYMCAKGMNPVRRMEYLLKLVGELNDCHVADLDGSAFDAHVSPQALRVEWAGYHTAAKVAGYRRTTLDKIRSFGKAHLKNKCRGRFDDGTISYTVDGNRMSGDLTTGLGNTYLQCGFITAAMAELEIPSRSWRALVDGDDCVLLVEGKFVSLLGRLKGIFEGFSMRLKVGAAKPVSTTSMEAIQFCQCSPVWVEPTGWRLLRDPRKVYNGYKMDTKWLKDREGLQRFYATVAAPEMIYAAGTPVLDAFFRMLHRLSGDAKPLEVVTRRFWLRNCEALRETIPASLYVEMLTRESFARAFGFAIADQLAVEAEFDHWTVDHLPAEPSYT